MSWTTNITLVGLLFTVTCFGTAMGDVSCVTDAKINDAKAKETTLVTALAGQNVSVVLMKLCMEQPLRTAMGALKTAVMECPLLEANLTTLALLTVGSKTFFEFEKLFKSVDEFCMCAPHLMDAWYFKMNVAMKVKADVDDGIYEHVIDPEVLCKNASDELMENLFKGATNCSSLFMHAGAKSVQELGMLMYTKKYFCDGYDSGTYMCTTTASQDQGLKNCIVHENQMTSDKKQLLCRRRSCVKDTMEKANCTDGNINMYIAAVNAREDNTLIKDGDCSAATAAQLSAFLLLACALIRSFF